MPEKKTKKTEDADSPDTKRQIVGWEEAESDVLIRRSCSNSSETAWLAARLPGWIFGPDQEPESDRCYRWQEYFSAALMRSRWKRAGNNAWNEILVWGLINIVSGVSAGFN